MTSIELASIGSFSFPGGDVDIILQDSHGKIEIQAHREFLAKEIPYFDKLFSFADNTQKREFTVQVQDAQVASLFLRSLYGDKITWTPRQKLHLLLLKSFFCLEVPFKELKEFALTPENFDLFLQVVNLPEIEVDQKIIRKIQDNVPAGYDWKGIDKNFQRMIVKQRRIALLYGYSSAVEILDLETGKGKIVHRYDESDYFYEKMFLTKDPEVIILTSMSSIFLLNIEDRSVRKILHKIGFCGQIVVMEDRERIIISCAKNKIAMWNILTNQHLFTYSGFKSAIESISLTKDEKKLFVTTKNDIFLVDVSTGDVITSYKKDRHKYKLFTLLSDGERFMCCDRKDYLKLCDINTGKVILDYHKLEGHNHDYGQVWGANNIIITSDDKYAIASGERDYIELWILERAKLCKIFHHDDQVTFISLMSDQRHLVTSSQDGTLKIWDIFGGDKCIKSIFLQSTTNSSIHGKKQGGVWLALLLED